MDIQKMMDGLNAATRMQRSSYHLTLGKAIERLSNMPDQTLPVFIDYTDEVPGKVASYRGYYDDLAISPEDSPPPTVDTVLSRLQGALGETFEGYKGGDFVMDHATPLWIARYGDADDIAVIGLDQSDTAVTFITKDLSEE